jgi:hypothetical protein
MDPHLDINHKSVYLILVAEIVWVDLQHTRVNEVCH